MANRMLTNNEMRESIQNTLREAVDETYAHVKNPARRERLREKAYKELLPLAFLSLGFKVPRAAKPSRK